nr:hypothetical protein CFP56_55982 [Quercus suber]
MTFSTANDGVPEMLLLLQRFTATTKGPLCDGNVFGCTTGVVFEELGDAFCWGASFFPRSVQGTETYGGHSMRYTRGLLAAASRA